VRPASSADEQQVLAWRNDPFIVALGLSGRTVSGDEHHRWFQESIKEERRKLFIVETDEKPIGTVRYDFHSPDEAEISIYLFPPHPGHGLGNYVARSTLPSMFARGIRRIIATVLRRNQRSLNFFLRLGFRELRVTDEAYTLMLERPVVPHSRPYLSEAESIAVADVFKTRHLAQGPQVERLEKTWCEITHMTGAVAVGSGVGALRLALVALGVAGYEVIVPAYSCVALMNAVLAAGATPVLADIVPEEWTLSPADVKDRMSRRTAAIIAVHLFGMPARMNELTQFGVPVIEDCAHGVGGRCGDIPFGGAGEMNIASFYATKMFCSGEGGIVAARNAVSIDRLRAFRDYGDRPADGRKLNDKMTDIEAALAGVQLNRMPDILSLRAQRALQYDQALQELQDEGTLVLPAQSDGRIWYRYAVRLTKRMAKDVVAEMKSQGVHVEQPVWDLRSSERVDGLSATNLAFDHVLSLPLYPDLSEAEQAAVTGVLQRCLR
jgi:dTDP-4-amino-4,6-dideoxygalactose transaminase/L-amino acid N-acyltransferase YncA